MTDKAAFIEWFKEFGEMSIQAAGEICEPVGSASVPFLKEFVHSFKDDCITIVNAIKTNNYSKDDLIEDYITMRDT